VTLFAIVALYQIVEGVQAIAQRALRGLKDTFVPMWIAVVGLWVVGVSGGYALCFPLGFGAAGLWWGLIAGVLITVILLVWRFHRQFGMLPGRPAASHPDFE
jgi:MATE family multidrug resistance protein